MTIRVLLPGLLLCICLPASAQQQADDFLLTNVGIWDGSTAVVQINQHVLIIAGEIVAVDSEIPRVPSDTEIIDGSGHVAVGTIVPGRIANFLVLDANPQNDISVLAHANRHMQLLVKDGQIIENNFQLRSAVVSQK
jgi:imidazolonepropionase-like amidohydrolase